MSIPSHLMGRKVRCAKCRMTFVAEDTIVAEIADEEDEKEDEEEVTGPRRRRRRKGFCCIHCGSHEEPDVSTQVSTGGWVGFAVLLLLTLPGIIFSGNFAMIGPAILICCIALLIREDYRTCSDCGIRLG
jgi:hypothetical protein